MSCSSYIKQYKIKVSGVDSFIKSSDDIHLQKPLLAHLNLLKRTAKFAYRCWHGTDETFGKYK